MKSPLLFLFSFVYFLLINDLNAQDDYIISGNSSKKAKTSPLSEKARSLNPLPGKALVYLFQNGPFGNITISINANDTAVLFNKQFFIGSYEPGNYKFCAGANNEDALILNLEPDRKYYISVGSQASGDQVASTILFGVSGLEGSPSVKLELFDLEKGDKCIKKCKLFWMNVNKEAQMMLGTQ